MIGALQGPRTDSLSQAARTLPGNAAANARGGDSRAGDARNSSGTAAFQETRGTSVAAGTLIAAQIAASAEKQPLERTGTDPKQSITDGTELTAQEREQVKELQARDREVRTHEQAHATAGGQYAGSPEYEMEQGPDGRSYAVGGHVSISTSPIAGDPQATIAKMDVVKRAALAPAEPSGADRSVAADADAKRADARAELTAMRAEEQKAALEGDREAEASDAAPVIGPDASRPDGRAEGRPEPGGRPDGPPAFGPGMIDPFARSGSDSGSDSGSEPRGGSRFGDDRDGEDAGLAQRRDDQTSRDFAAFLSQTDSQRARADLQPGLSAQRQSIDIRL
ncbi:MAG: putative metalloprotease CJM1_0395 family protein [Minwuia sp.]|nr:putative metalloprotease CJM1_0395 family protein [Minwuia sp.]